VEILQCEKELNMQISAYLLFHGQCEEAFKFYEKALGGKIVGMMTHGESPMAQQVASEWRGKIIHVRLLVGDQALMGSDVPPEQYEAPQGFSVSLGVKDPAEADRVFNALAQNGKVTLPIQKTFWSVRFGMVVDRFGIPWMINCEQAA
jgi:PhnB protein